MVRKNARTVRSWVFEADVSIDTVYGCQDKKDDIKVGVWSSSLFFGDYVWSVSVVLDTLFVACLYLAGVVNGHGMPYFAISVAGTAVQFIYQLATLDTNSEKSCWCKAVILSPFMLFPDHSASACFS